MVTSDEAQRGNTSNSSGRSIAELTDLVENAEISRKWLARLPQNLKIGVEP